MFVSQDVNEAYAEMQARAVNFCEPEANLYVFKYPVLLHSPSPSRRVLFSSSLDANPFLQYMGALWMLSGSANVDFLSRFSPQFRSLAGDGITLRSANGHRMRLGFGRDQIDTAIHLLKEDSKSLGVVVQIWSPNLDLERGSYSIPSNTELLFRVVDNALTMTVIGRDNDLEHMLVYDYVNFGILLEYIAESCGMMTGGMYQFSNRVQFHRAHTISPAPPSPWYYDNPMFMRHVFGPDTIDLHELKDFVEEPDQLASWKSPILEWNAGPMFRAWSAYQSDQPDRFDLAIHMATRIHDSDWKFACVNWLERRHILNPSARI